VDKDGPMQGFDDDYDDEGSDDEGSQSTKPFYEDDNLQIQPPDDSIRLDEPIKGSYGRLEEGMISIHENGKIMKKVNQKTILTLYE
jgi:hypothetical protein